MFDSIVRIKDFDKEAKKRERKEKRRQRIRNAGEWIGEHKTEICIFGPVVIGLLTTSVKGVVKINTTKKEQMFRDKYCYDPSLGHYWKLKRPLSSREWVTVDRRKQMGERLSDILVDLNVLK